MWATVRAWSGSARAGRCRYCRKPIVWVMLEEGGQMPLDMGFTIREVVIEPKRQARFIVLNKSDRHDCSERRAWLKAARAGNPLTKDRMRGDS